MNALFGRRGWTLLAWPLLLVAGCDRRDEAASSTSLAAASASALAPSVADPSAKAQKFVVDANGKATIDMPAPAEHITGDATLAGGALDVDLANLANTRGEVRIDLTSLKTHTFGDKRDASQTEHAQTWLEVNEKTAPNAAADNRWVVFAIRSIDGLSGADLAKIPPAVEGADQVRTVTLTAHGDFLLHGHKVPKDAALEVKVHYAPGASADAKPTGIDIRSKTPLHVVLADHDVKPRDNLGVIAQRSFGLFGTKVAETADVTLTIHAAPAS